ncbi:uncharacterized protein LOC144352025 [Saccoglossus kowalevskii]
MLIDLAEDSSGSGWIIFIIVLVIGAAVAVTVVVIFVIKKNESKNGNYVPDDDNTRRSDPDGLDVSKTTNENEYETHSYGVDPAFGKPARATPSDVQSSTSSLRDTNMELLYAQSQKMNPQKKDPSYNTDQLVYAELQHGPANKSLNKSTVPQPKPEATTEYAAIDLSKLKMK